MNERVPSLTVGGTISAIIPQSIEETWRLATMIVEGGLAPQALVGREPPENASLEVFQRWAKKGTSAVSIVILSGAELGLPPMVSLRAFTVIGGKPALYADGLINVSRRSRFCKSLKTGYLHEATPQALIKLGVDEDKVATLKTPEERSVGWCDSTRSDTGERSVEIFSITQAKKAGLWDDRQIVRRKVYGEWKDVQNDAPWFRFPDRMLKWRAAGYCLRELYADVLGGIRDEFEAREIAGETIDHDVNEQPRPQPPKPPSPPKPPKPLSPSATKRGEGIDPIPDNGFDKDLLGDPIEPEEQFDFGHFFEQLKADLDNCNTPADVEEVWNDLDIEAKFENDDESRQLADKLKWARLSVVNPTGGI